MPTVLRIDGLRVVIYANDHRPAHVHVMGGGKEAVFELHCPEGPPKLRSSRGLRLREVKRIGEALTQALRDLCEEWRRLHGRY